MARLCDTTELRTRDTLAVVGVPVVIDGIAIREGNEENKIAPLIPDLNVEGATGQLKGNVLRRNGKS